MKPTFKSLTIAQCEWMTKLPIAGHMYRPIVWGLRRRFWTTYGLINLIGFAGILLWLKREDNKFQQQLRPFSVKFD